MAIFTQSFYQPDITPGPMACPLDLCLTFHSTRQFCPSCVVAMFFSILTFNLFLCLVTDPKGLVKIVFADELFSLHFSVVDFLKS